MAQSMAREIPGAVVDLWEALMRLLGSGGARTGAPAGGFGAWGAGWQGMSLEGMKLFATLHSVACRYVGTCSEPLCGAREGLSGESRLWGRQCCQGWDLGARLAERPDKRDT